MIAVAFWFTAGRFHATPWGRHVSEGVAEWPPSPWRILRALASAWQRVMPEADEGRVAGLLGKLSSPPQYSLPPATVGTSKHFVPWDDESKPKDLIFDTFVVVPRDRPLVAIWPDVQLEPEERRLLQDMLMFLPYLGRSESWCQAGIVERFPAPNCHPLDDLRAVPEDTEVTWSLAPRCPLDLGDLMEGTAELQRRRLKDPPGSRWIPYCRPHNCLVPPPRPASKPLRSPPCTVVWYSVDATVLPPMTEALRVTERLRAAGMSVYGRITGGMRSAILAGKSEDGTPLVGHRHAHYLAVDEDSDGFIDHLVVWAPGGFGERERLALSQVRRLNLRDGRPSLRLVCLRAGIDRQIGSRLFDQARVWVSGTPFLLVRHWKRRGGQVVEGPEDQVRLEFSRRGLPQPEVVEWIDGRDRRYSRWPWLQYRRWRSTRYQTALPWAFGFRVVFPVPVRGPLVVGGHSHFGMGLFVPAEDCEGG